MDLLLHEMHHDSQVIPKPSKLLKSEVTVPVSPEIAVLILLRQLRRQLRKQHQYTYSDVEKVMGVSYQTYQQIESGKNITLKSLKKAAMALGATVEIRFFTDGSPPVARILNFDEKSGPLI